VALLATIGAGFKWLLNWDDRRKRTRHDKLEAWQRELERREKEVDDRQAEYYRKVETELNKMRAQNAALVGAYQLIVAALRVESPTNPALGQADELLKTAFPLDPITPPAMAGLLNKMP
jgi:hypothetical protein